MFLVKVNQLRLVWFLFLQLKLDLMVGDKSLNIVTRVYFTQCLLDEVLSPQANLAVLVRSAPHLTELQLSRQRVCYVHRLSDSSPKRHNEVVPLHIVKTIDLVDVELLAM